MRLSQRLCSSAAALAGIAEQLFRKVSSLTPKYRRRARELAADASRVTTHAKLKELGACARPTIGDRVIVFSEHLPTLELIAEAR